VTTRTQIKNKKIKKKINKVLAKIFLEKMVAEGRRKLHNQNGEKRN